MARDPWFGPDDTAACVRLGDAIRARGAWGDETDALFQEYVAREHLDGGMPVVELHRNHGIPLSAVKRWIATYRDEGRAGLERAAQAARERAAKREKAALAKGAKPEELAGLRTMIESGDIDARRKAYKAIARRMLVTMVPVILEAIRRANAKPAEISIQDELDLLAALRAKHALHELLTSKLAILHAYESWFSGLMRKAGCAVETIEKPWSEHYELDGTWYPLP